MTKLCVQVSEVKQVIKEEMLAAGQAIVYSEPERQVMSRSGDICVVALTDQWYINYGENEWRDATRHASCSHDALDCQRLDGEA